jgi:hypothetical protein
VADSCRLLLHKQEISTATGLKSEMAIFRQLNQTQGEIAWCSILTTIRIPGSLVPIAITGVKELLVGFILFPGSRHHVRNAYASRHGQRAPDIKLQHFLFVRSRWIDPDIKVFGTGIYGKHAMQAI